MKGAKFQDSGDSLQSNMMITLDEDYLKKLNKSYYYLKDANATNEENKIESGNSITFKGDTNITTKIQNTSEIVINLSKNLKILIQLKIQIKQA